MVQLRRKIRGRDPRWCIECKTTQKKIKTLFGFKSESEKKVIQKVFRVVICSNGDLNAAARAMNRTSFKTPRNSVMWKYATIIAILGHKEYEALVGRKTFNRVKDLVIKRGGA